MKLHRVYACESQPVVVEGLKKVLGAGGEFEFCGAAANTAEAVAEVRLLKPDLALIDQAFGLRSAFQLAAEIREVSPDTYAILWAHEIGEMESLRALQAGIRGIIKRNQPVSTLLECLRSVTSGAVWMEISLSRLAAGYASRRSAPRFTPREREIVELVCRGLKNRQIAEALSITPGTVKVHLMHIFEKAGVRDRFELALQGARLTKDLEQPLGEPEPVEGS
jgi:DNA-binding NarL/FixJ family response regulator